MKVTSLREPKMADRVAQALRKLFIQGTIPEGSMLPPESELMEQFGVSRVASSRVVYESDLISGTGVS